MGYDGWDYYMTSGTFGDLHILNCGKIDGMVSIAAAAAVGMGPGAVGVPHANHRRAGHQCGW